MVGQTVGKYRIVSRLGRGGMGTVYKAVDETLDREVAVKVLNAELTDPDLMKRFRAEAFALARLNHPNIATLFELGDHDGQMLMVMEFVRGETFDRVSQREGPMDVPRAAQLCAQVLDALDHAHRTGIVHRDLKPANLMLTQAGLVKVMDFGLARMIGTEHLTSDGYMVGTPAYMAPEQVMGHDIDGRADLYAMGVVLFRLLTSQLPFTADSGIAMVQRQLHDTPTPARHVRKELPEACDEILMRALEKVAGNRYQTASEFRSALTRLDPGLAPSSTSRLAVPATADIEATLPLTPTPKVSAAAGPPPATVVLPKTLELATPRAPAHRLSRRGLGFAVGLGAVLLAVIAGGVLYVASQLPHEAGSPSREAIVRPPQTPAAPVVTSVTPPPPLIVSKSAPEPALVKKAAGKSPKLEVPADAAALRDLPVAIFSRIKLLIVGEARPRDRDVTLRLANDGFEVLDGSRAVESAAWADVIGLYYSHSREPRWTDANGQPGPIAKSAASGFPFFKGTPDWITLRTKRNFVPLRVREEDVTRLTSELEARAGSKIVSTK